MDFYIPQPMEWASRPQLCWSSQLKAYKKVLSRIYFKLQLLSEWRKVPAPTFSALIGFVAHIQISKKPAKPV
jgi:hypothetical protein